jgi:hypothetical protein
LTLFFDPARINTRSERFTWLPSGARDMADRIEIIQPHDSEKLNLVLKNGKWFALLEGPAGSIEAPVKQGRIDDIFRLLGTRGAFPRRGSSAGSHEMLGLGANASRLTVRGGQGQPLLDLLVGNTDSSGTEVFLRKSGENEFRSGDRLISSYVNAGNTSWYDLKLFDEIPMALVQRVRVNFYDYTGPEFEEVFIGYLDYNIVRRGENWFMNDSEMPLDRESTESWIRTLLEAQGDDFLPPSNEFTATSFPAIAMITVELGNGSSWVLQIGEARQDAKNPALVSGKPYAFSLPNWTVTRLLREQGYFRSGE